MSVLPVGFGSSGGIDTGDIEHSLRCRGAQYLNRTFGAPTTNTSWAFSIWAKPCSRGVTRSFLSPNNSEIKLNTSNQLQFNNSAGASVATSTAVFRDSTSPFHLFVRSNGTNIKGYVNNVEVISYTGTLTEFNSAIQHCIGRLGGGASQWMDGYLSRICFVDNGGSLTPGDFAYLNTEINEWVTKTQSAVKAVVDAGGTNSFMLDFDDATSLTTLGYDKSSKGNNWTLNNFSLTAGTTYDHMLDVPGNSYATLNPLFNPSTQSKATLAEGNLGGGQAATNVNCSCTGSVAMSSGKWYWEAVASIPANYRALGIAKTTATAWRGTGTVIYRNDGQKQLDGVNSAYGATYTTGDVIGFALDFDAGTLTCYKNNVSQGTIYSSLGGSEWVPYFADDNAGAGVTYYHTFVFGQAPLHASATYDSAAGGYFRYAPPTGFKALCQANLPTPAILNPKLHFDVVTYAGNSASTRTFTGLQFQPDKIDTKSRSSAYDWMLFDSVRGAGATKDLQSCTTNAEGTNGANYGYVSAFNSDGYTITNGSLAADLMNETGYNYVANCWKAGGAAVSNTAGSITSQVSANVDAGFSIVTYTGTGANATVGHGLGKAPKLVIVKSRATIAGSADWLVGHNSIGWNNAYLFLNTTQATLGSEYVWGNPTGSAPTSSVINLGTSTQCNKSANPYIAYCFTDIEGYSKIGSYTGAASATGDGPCVNLGFKPKFLMGKRTDVAGPWWIVDGAREPSNKVYLDLQPNSAYIENNVTDQDPGQFDFTSNGFKVRTLSGDTNAAYTNATGGTYIFIAFADVAGKYSLGR